MDLATLRARVRRQDQRRRWRSQAERSPDGCRVRPHEKDRLLWRGFLSDLYDWRVVSLDEHEEELASRTAGVPVQDSFANSLPIAGPKGKLP